MSAESPKVKFYEGDEVRLSIMIGGEAGYGIVSAGEILARTFAKCTLHVNAYSEVPSLIRGGHNSFQICVSTHKMYCIWESLNFLIALDKMTIWLNAQNITPGGYLVYDSDEITIEDGDIKRDDYKVIPMPLTSMAKEHGSATVMRNTVALGVAIALSRYDCETLEEVLRSHFALKSDKIIEANVRSAWGGFNYIKENHPELLIHGLEGQVCGLPQKVLSGNQAIAMGALRAGMTFYSGYPMTPASPLLHWLIQLDEEFGLVVKQTEDEISAITMAIGASSAGARAMTGTSGGGFCLMTEGLGLAGEAEVPLVVMLGQRPGPSTGLATRTDQSDLWLALHASQGEFPRGIITPGDLYECYRLTFRAFNLAEEYQVPVIIMGDRFLNEGIHCTTYFAEEDLFVDRGRLMSNPERLAKYIEDGHFKRYALTDDGISPRVPWGTPGIVQTYNGNEHNEFGDTYEGRRNRRAQMEKRMWKFEGLKNGMPHPFIIGPPEAEVTLVCWGSGKLPCQEALKMLEADGHTDVNIIHFPAIWPLHWDVVRERLQGAKRLVGVEANYTGQLSQLIARETLIKIEDRILKYDGRPITPNYIILQLKELMGW
jgi:2-oxoglutarate ferredoxin oxidoreductase subunit alpha